MLCPRCRFIIGSQDSECPHCGLKHPRAWWRRTFFSALSGDPAMALRAILYTNIAIFALSLLINPRGMAFSMNPFMFLTPDLRSLLLMGATGTIPIDRFGRWWTLVSASYLHAGLLHIVFNMMALNQLWQLVAREYGVPRTFTIYTAGGVAGFYLSYLVGVPVTIGASAAVCGLMGAALYYGKSRGGIYGEIIYRQIGGWVIGLFIFGFVVSGINNWGHAGGILAGIGAGYLVGYEENRKDAPLDRWISAGLAVCTVLALTYALGSAFVFR